MVGIIDMVCPPGIGCPFTSGFGIAEILLWVLTFAITFAVLKGTVLGKRTGALVAIAVAFLVLMTVPTALIEFVASMSTGLIVLAIGALVLLSVFGLSQTGGSIWGKYNTIISLIVAAIVIAMFASFGGLGLIGITTLPTIAPGMWLLILVGAAIIWMLSESEPKIEKSKEEKK